MLRRPVYLDNHATTRTDPRVVEAMLPFFTVAYGNPSSTAHHFGWEAADALERARGHVAALIGAEPSEVIFTSGATESNNLALKGALRSPTSRCNHVVTTAVEHRSVLEPLKRLARAGWDLTIVAPDRTGLVSAQAIAEALNPKTVLVSVIAANHEVGTINPLTEIGRLCRERGILFHTDTTQAVGKVHLDVTSTSVDLLSLSGHKFHGPKGIGAVYVRRSGDRQPRLEPQVFGGGQERGLRSGTVPVPLAVGLGEACTIAQAERDDEIKRVASLRDRLHGGILARIGHVRLNGHPTERLPGNLSLSFAGVDGEALMTAMREVAVSAGAACTTGRPEPSPVLMAIGLDEALARSTLRFGLSRFTTSEEVDYAAVYVAEAVARLRNVAAVAGRSGI